MRELPFKADDAGCWIWQGFIDRDGYGRVNRRVNGVRYQAAHRLTYVLAKGSIPSGSELDHLCRVKACVNPDHLEPVSHDENIRRRYETYDQCVNGHDYTPDNTYLMPSGYRDCKACIRERARRYKARRLAAS